MGCGVRPEAVPGSASTRPNRDGAAGGSQSQCHVFGGKRRAQEPLFSALKLETLLTFSDATGRPIPVWPRARRARHRLRPGPAAHGTSTSCWAARALARPWEAPTEALRLAGGSGGVHAWRTSARTAQPDLGVPWAAGCGLRRCLARRARGQTGMERPVAARASAPSSEPSIALSSASSLPLKLETLLMFSAATGGPIHVWHRSHRPKHRLRPGPAAHGPSTSCWAARASARPLGAPTEALGLPVAPAVVTRGDQVLIRPSLTSERLGLRGAA